MRCMIFGAQKIGRLCFCGLGWPVPSIRGQSPDRLADQRTVPAIDHGLPWDDVGIVPYGEICNRCNSFRCNRRGGYQPPGGKWCVYMEVLSKP